MGDTLNRNYPYPDGPTAPNNVPYDLQQLAEAVDADVNTLFTTGANATGRLDDIEGALAEPVRGAETVTSPIGAGAAWSKAVSFGKTFDAEPHVSVTLLGSSGGTGGLVPRIASLTATGFTLLVYNTSTSNNSWSGTMQVIWRATP